MEKRKKAIKKIQVENKGRKLFKVLQSLNSNQQLKLTIDLFLKNILKNQAKDNIGKIKKIGKEVIRNNLIYKTVNKKVKTCVFQKVKKLIFFWKTNS